MITVLRLGHRKKRDVRLTTHCCLVARAFGAGKIVLSGEKDVQVMNSIKKVVKNWGGHFKIEHQKSWKSWLKKQKSKKVHLTMYGLPFQKDISVIRKHKNLIVIIGSEKVPGEVYGLSDYNIAITSQPHSEAAALAIFLYEYSKRKLKTNFKNAKLKIKPQKKGKKVAKLR